MEALSARMAPAFKNEESWKYKRAYESNKHARLAEAKMDHRSERAGNSEIVPHRESGHRKLHGGDGSGWEGGNRQLVVARSVMRMNPEGASTSNGHSRKLEMPQESSDEPETSQDGRLDDSDSSGDEEPGSPEATEAPQKWPIIQIVDPPPWLPEGWTAVLRTRESGSKDKYYVDPVSQRRFRSKTEVNYFLQTGKSYRYKRNLALLTKPLKEDPVSLPNTVPLRNVPVDVPSSRDTLPFMSPSSAYAGEQRATASGRSAVSPDLGLSMLPAQAELPRKIYNKPGPKPKIKVLADDPGRSLVSIAQKRSAMEERKSAESSQVQGTENRGKLILKLKRKTAEPDEGQRNGKKPRPFEVVGTTPVLQGKSRSSTSDEEERHHQKNSWAVDHAIESTSRALVPHSLVPSTHVSRRPISKAPLPPWHYQSQSLIGSRAQQIGNPNGQGLVLDRASGSATLATTESETVKHPAKRESPAEQLQKLGRKLCQQAFYVLSSEYGENNTLQQISSGLHAAMGHGLNSGFSTHVNNASNPAYSPGFHITAPYQQHQPAKKMRGSVPKERSMVPSQKYGLDQHQTLVAQAR